jgi:predicted Fe-Mo cluster-binding NifX family protein
MYMSLGKLRVAIPTKGQGGLEDSVSDVFGRANTFTILDIEEDTVKNVKVLKNPAVSYEHGAGPIVVKILVDAGVNVVLSGELGPGASALLKQHNVIMIAVKPGILVSEAIRKVSWSTINIHI